MNKAACFWVSMSRSVFLPALATLLAFIAPVLLMTQAFATGYLLILATMLAWLAWRTIVNNNPPAFIRLLGF